MRCQGRNDIRERHPETFRERGEENRPFTSPGQNIIHFVSLLLGEYKGGGLATKSGNFTDSFQEEPFKEARF